MTTTLIEPRAVQSCRPPVPPSFVARCVRHIFPSLLLAGIVTVLLWLEPFSGPQPTTDKLLFDVQLTSTTGGVARLFFDDGGGFNAGRAALANIASGGPQTAHFLVPPGTYRAFRFEGPAAGGVEIADARVIDLAGREVARFEGRQFRADGALACAPALVLRPAFAWSARQAGGCFVLVALGSVLALGLAEPWLAGQRASVAAALHRLAGQARDRPVLTLFATATVAVAVSCHPVIFFGKSFVSPNNGAACLYANFPTVPGAPEGPVENGKFSDVGAMLWWHLPYSMIERRAVFHDHELPLRNRYTFCGVPLLGQGQAMLGDPLHWIALLADGASWAWDLKFVLAKVIFALGVGLVVQAAVGRLGVAVALAASSAFIGFFSYRFNHAAFFSLSYAPWLLLAWLKIARAPAWRDAVRWVGLLMVADWMELNSGTAKEAVILMLALNGTGALMVILAAETVAARARKLAVAAAGLLGFLLVSAPCWLVFLGALRQAFTSYNAPSAYQIQPGLFLGLFDDLFYRQTTKWEMHTNPAANFFVLLGVLWALVQVRRLAANRLFLALALGTLPAFALAFGVVAPALIVKLPFLGNISHIDNTFSCALIVLLFPLAGFGLQACRDYMKAATWRGDWIVTLLLAAVLAAGFLGYTQVATRSPFALIREGGAVPKSPFFCGYAIALFLALAILPLAARSLLRGGGMLTHGLLAALCMFALHFRQGMYLETKFDPYVMNPQERMELRAPSPAVGYVQAHLPEPGRVLGFGDVLTPGFNVALGLESMAGTDPLLSPFHHELTHAMKLDFIWDNRLHLIKPNTQYFLPFYDFFNVRYYLGTVGETPRAVPGLKLIGSRDLEVYESPTVWPRAFFSDTVVRYRDAGNFAQMLYEGDHRPLAAMQENAGPAVPLPGDLAARRIVPASAYRATGNTTAFTIDAPAAGVAVLSETYEEGNFRVTLNGARVQPFRVNHTFQGILIPQAGRFAVRFEYWPRLLTPSLWLAAAGLAYLAVAGWFLRMKNPGALAVTD